jgi:hypothetical protein
VLLDFQSTPTSTRSSASRSNVSVAIRTSERRSDALRVAGQPESTISTALSLMRLVVDGGRLATITGDPPVAERQIRVSDCYVSPSGIAIEQLARSFTERGLAIPVAGVFGLSQAGTALSEAISGKAMGGVLIDPRR